MTHDLTFHNTTDHHYSLEGWAGRALMVVYHVAPHTALSITPTPHFDLAHLDWVHRPLGSTAIRMLKA